MVGGNYTNPGQMMNNLASIPGQNPNYQNYNNPQFMNPGGSNPNMNSAYPNQGYNPNMQRKMVWKWDCEDGTHKPYEDSISDYIEQCYNSNIYCQFTLKTDKGPKNYTIDFQAMKQVNIDTKFLKPVYREYN